MISAGRPAFNSLCHVEQRVSPDTLSRGRRISSSCFDLLSPVRGPRTNSLQSLPRHYDITPTEKAYSSEDRDRKFDLFSCPICYEPLMRKGVSGLTVDAIYRSSFKCQTCQKTFSSKEVYLDLIVTSGTTDYNESKLAGTELFRNPLVSYLYERGWRDNFSKGGFPGLDIEFRMAQKYFEPVAGGFLLDVSCGTGLFSRKFAISAIYSGVIALDFSETMLRQCYEFIKKDDWLSNSNIALVRADVLRLPFSTGSLDAVYAGASLQCWSSPSNAVAEISRVLRSQGLFVATTFLDPSDDNPYGVSWPFIKAFGQITNSYRYFTQKEIEELCKTCGLVNYTSEVDRAFIMFSAQKP